VGVDGFIKIWETLPGFGWLATIGKNSFLKPILIFGYRFFAKIRPYLPRLKRDDICETGICDRKEII
jgi:predicted DCC family thiol-disulfide oxidoreductase YuxK